LGYEATKHALFFLFLSSIDRCKLLFLNDFQCESSRTFSAEIDELITI